MSGRKQGFGSLVRQERERRKIGLRDMARQIGVSPTYLSMIERGEFPPPAEDKVSDIAKIIDRDRDELLALAGRISTDLEKKILASPREMAGLVRKLSEFSRADLVILQGCLAQSLEFKLGSRSPLAALDARKQFSALLSGAETAAGPLEPEAGKSTIKVERRKPKMKAKPTQV